MSVYFGEPSGRVFDGVFAAPKAYGLLDRLTTVIGEVCRVGPGVVMVEDVIVDKPFEDALSQPM